MDCMELSPCKVVLTRLYTEVERRRMQAPDLVHLSPPAAFSLE
jgi:hypothetical protein